MCWGSGCGVCRVHRGHRLQPCTQTCPAPPSQRRACSDEAVRLNPACAAPHALQPFWHNHTGSDRAVRMPAAAPDIAAPPAGAHAPPPVLAPARGGNPASPCGDKQMVQCSGDVEQWYLQISPRHEPHHEPHCRFSSCELEAGRPLSCMQGQAPKRRAPCGFPAAMLSTLSFSLISFALLVHRSCVRLQRGGATSWPGRSRQAGALLTSWEHCRTRSPSAHAQRSSLWPHRSSPLATCSRLSVMRCSRGRPHISSARSTLHNRKPATKHYTTPHLPQGKNR